MYLYTQKPKINFVYRTLCAFIAFTFLFTTILPPAHAQMLNLLNLPLPGAMVTPTPAFMPVMLEGMTLHPDNPLEFDFIIDEGDTHLSRRDLKRETEKLVKYFLASMTIPKDDLWVNLSPYEKNRIIPDELGKTELGRDMLAQDYILKQLTASLVYPEDDLGKKFWDRVYKKAYEQFGTTDIPVNTFNKVWVLPEKAVVYENGNTVYIVESKLKVMLDADFLASREAQGHKDTRSQISSQSPVPSPQSLGTDIVREIILPEIEREVNEGKNFAPLRQIYNSLILAKWYKETVKESLLNKVYADKRMIDGVDIEDKNIKDKIYGRYMQAYKKGVYDYIREDYDEISKQPIPRKYFSGGEELTAIPLEGTDPVTAEQALRDKDRRGGKHGAEVEVRPEVGKTTDDTSGRNAEDAARELLRNNEVTITADDGKRFIFKLKRPKGEWYSISAGEATSSHGENFSDVGYFDFYLGFAGFGYDRGPGDSFAIEVYRTDHKGVGRAMVSLALALSKMMGKTEFEIVSSTADSFWMGLGFVKQDDAFLPFDFTQDSVPDIKIVHKSTPRVVPRAILYEKSISSDDEAVRIEEARAIAAKNPGSRIIRLKEGVSSKFIRVESEKSGTILFEDSVFYFGDRGDLIKENNERVEEIERQAQAVQENYPNALIIKRVVYYGAFYSGEDPDFRITIIVMQENREEDSESDSQGTAWDAAFRDEFIAKIKEGKASFAMLKPDAIEQGKVDEILSMLREKGFDVVVGPKVQVDRETAEDFYAVHKGKPFFEGLIAYLTSNHGIPLFVTSDSNNTVKELREVIEDIREKFKAGERRNFIHGSDTKENALIEFDIAYRKFLFGQQGGSEKQGAMKASEVVNSKQLILYSGPSAVGKSPLWERIQELYPDYFQRIVLYTSRAMRPGEQEGVDYYFRTKEEILAMAEKNRNFVTILVHGDIQGIDLDEVERAVRGGKRGIAEVSVDWAKLLRDKFPEKVFSIFISPLSDEELRRRAADDEISEDEVIYNEMIGRQRERSLEMPTNEDKQETRARNAVSEMSRRIEYDAVIVNDELRDIKVHQPLWGGEQGSALVQQFIKLVEQEPSGVQEDKPGPGPIAGAIGGAILSGVVVEKIVGALSQGSNYGIEGGKFTANASIAGFDWQSVSEWVSTHPGWAIAGALSLIGIPLAVRAYKSVPVRRIGWALGIAGVLALFAPGCNDKKEDPSTGDDRSQTESSENLPDSAMQAKQDAENKAKQEAEEKAKKEAQEKVRREAEEEARRISAMLTHGKTKNTSSEAENIISFKDFSNALHRAAARTNNVRLRKNRVFDEDYYVGDPMIVRFFGTLVTQTSGFDTMTYTRDGSRGIIPMEEQVWERAIKRINATGGVNKRFSIGNPVDLDEIAMFDVDLNILVAISYFDWLFEEIMKANPAASTEEILTLALINYEANVAADGELILNKSAEPSWFVKAIMQGFVNNKSIKKPTESTTALTIAQYDAEAHKYLSQHENTQDPKPLEEVIKELKNPRDHIYPMLEILEYDQSETEGPSFVVRMRRGKLERINSDGSGERIPASMESKIKDTFEQHPTLQKKGFVLVVSNKLADESKSAVGKNIYQLFRRMVEEDGNIMEISQFVFRTRVATYKYFSRSESGARNLVLFNLLTSEAGDNSERFSPALSEKQIEALKRGQGLEPSSGWRQLVPIYGAAKTISAGAITDIRLTESGWVVTVEYTQDGLKVQEVYSHLGILSKRSRAAKQALTKIEKFKAQGQTNIGQELLDALRFETDEIIALARTIDKEIGIAQYNVRLIIDGKGVKIGKEDAMDEEEEVVSEASKRREKIKSRIRNALVIEFFREIGQLKEGTSAEELLESLRKERDEGIEKGEERKGIVPFIPIAGLSGALGEGSKHGIEGGEVTANASMGMFDWQSVSEWVSTHPGYAIAGAAALVGIPLAVRALRSAPVRRMGWALAAVGALALFAPGVVQNASAQDYQNQAGQVQGGEYKEQQEIYNNQLIEAASIGNEEKVKELLRKGADVNARDSKGWTALMNASYAYNYSTGSLSKKSFLTKIIKLLLENGADVNAKGNDGETVLMIVSQNGQANFVKLFLENGADVNAADDYGTTSLFFASLNGTTESVKLLLADVADVNAQNDKGATSLMIASYVGHAEVVGLLLENGADVTLKNFMGETALDIARKAKNSQVEKILRKNKSQSISPEERQRYTDNLVDASYRGDINRVEFAINQGADVDGFHSMSELEVLNPLIAACGQGHVRIVELLIENGADVNSYNNPIMTPLSEAVREGHTEIVKILLGEGVEVNPLLIASSGNKEISDLLSKAWDEQIWREVEESRRKKKEEARKAQSLADKEKSKLPEKPAVVQKDNLYRKFMSLDTTDKTLIGLGIATSLLAGYVLIRRLRKSGGTMGIIPFVPIPGIIGALGEGSRYGIEGGQVTANASLGIFDMNMMSLASLNTTGWIIVGALASITGAYSWWSRHTQSGNIWRIRKFDHGSYDSIRNAVHWLEGHGGVKALSALERLLGEVPKTRAKYRAVEFSSITGPRWELDGEEPEPLRSQIEMAISRIKDRHAKDVGGIDMNKIEVEKQGAGVTIHFDPAQMQEIIDQGVTGFAPVVIDIVPISSILPLLGLGPRKEEEEELVLSKN